MKTLIKNANIINEGKIIKSDLLVFNNIIQEISKKIIPKGDEKIWILMVATYCLV